MAGSTTPFTFEFDPEFDFTLEEKANTYLALRRVKWGNSSEFKLDLRKYQATETGERMLKGCTFISDEGANELAKVLIGQGFGRDDELVATIKESRPKLYAEFVKDIKDISMDDAKSLVESELKDEDTYYDLREVI